MSVCFFVWAICASATTPSLLIVALMSLNFIFLKLARASFTTTEPIGSFPPRSRRTRAVRGFE